METREWLEKTTVGEIMCRNIVTLNANESLATAAAVLLSGQVTGAPVLDHAGVCGGVLSAGDFLGAEEKMAEERRQVTESGFFNSNLTLPVSVYADKLTEVRDKIAPAAEQPVERFMTTDLVSAREDTPLVTVIQNMVDAHIHRVVVLDEDQRLQGILTTTDVLAALLRQ